MKRLLFLALLLPISAGAYRYRPAPEPPARPRSWSVRIDGWQPTASLAWLRMSDSERMEARRNDRRVIANYVRLPIDATPVAVDLLVKLGKGQHRGANYWESLEDGLDCTGITGTRRGKVTYEVKRGVTRDDTATTVQLREGQ